MTVKEIKESGIIEYYVLGLLSEKEVNEVRGYLEKYPELQQDYNEIQSSMESYAKANGVPPRKGFSNEITDFINKNSTFPLNKKNEELSIQNKYIKPLRSLSRIIAFGLIALLIYNNKEHKELERSNTILKNECDSIQAEQTAIINIYESLNKPGNNSLLFTPTENYQNTQLIFHNNKTEKENFIQIQNLPEINNDQVFQLWSLKPGVDPIPLTVFKKGDDYILPVDFEDGTQTYAITIEIEGGAQVPTLTRLIATVGV